MRIIGIDPGTLNTGFAIVEYHEGQFTELTSGLIAQRSTVPLSQRLYHIYCRIETEITAFRPERFAIETAFYGKNTQSALKLGQARGAMMILAEKYQLHIAEYAPRAIKQSVTGKGNASKEQVEFMVSKLISRPATTPPRARVKFDQSDALAIALCDGLRARPETRRSEGYLVGLTDSGSRPNNSSRKRRSSSTWATYIAENPGTVIRPMSR